MIRAPRILASVIALAIGFAPMFAPAGAGAQTPPQADPDIVTPQAPPGRAAAGPARAFLRRFELANTTHDGNLTLAQAQAAGMGWIVNHYREVDTANKGFITLADIQQYRRDHPAAPRFSPASGAQAAAQPAGGGQTSGAAMQQANRQRFIDRFSAANTTHDGRLTITQAGAARMRWITDHFSAIDASAKGYVTLDDIRTYRRQTANAARPAAGVVR